MNIYELIYEQNLINSNRTNKLERCLITDKELDNNYITLDCKHKFNYIPLFNEVKSQKNTKNQYIDMNRPLINEIKCPYCRSITPKLLPYFSAIIDEKISGINFNNKFAKLQIHTCEHKLSKLNKVCGENACKTEYGCLCNKHYNLQKNKHLKKVKSINQNEEVSKLIKINNYLKDESYEKLLIPQLKILLKKNNCKVSGSKNILITRIWNKKKICIENNIIWHNEI